MPARAWNQKPFRVRVWHPARGRAWSRSRVSFPSLFVSFDVHCRFDIQSRKKCKSEKSSSVHSVHVQRRKIVKTRDFEVLFQECGVVEQQWCVEEQWCVALQGFQGTAPVPPSCPCCLVCLLRTYSRVPGSRNHSFWPSQRVSKHTLMKSETQPASVVSINH